MQIKYDFKFHGHKHYNIYEILMVKETMSGQTAPSILKTREYYVTPVICYWNRLLCSHNRMLLIN